MNTDQETLFIPAALALPLTYASYLFKAIQMAVYKSAYRRADQHRQTAKVTLA